MPSADFSCFSISGTSKPGEAIHDALHQWPQFELHLADGRVEIDNHLVESPGRLLPPILSRGPPEEKTAHRLAGAERRQYAIRTSGRLIMDVMETAPKYGCHFN